MTITTTAHLNFPGTARAALDFYRSVFGGEIFVSTYGEFGMPQDAPDAGKVVFGQLRSDSGFRVMAYDIPGPAAGGPAAAGASTHRANGVTITTQPFFLSARAETLDELTGYWDGLAEGATIVEPLAASAWTLGFGMLTDRFGVTWVLDVAAPYAG
jgi:PhnB protein